MTAGSSPKPITSDTITANNVFPSGVVGGTTVSFSISNMRNPPSTQPYGPTSISITYSGKVTQNCSSVYLTVSSPGTLGVAWSGLTNKNISASNTGTTLTITATNSFPSSGFLRIIFPTGIITYTGAASPTNYYSTSTSFSLTGFQATNAALNGILSTVSSFKTIYPTSTRPVYINFTTLTNSSGNVYLIDSVLKNLTAKAGVIVTATASSANLSVNALATATVTFTTLNNLVAGSFFTVQFPAELSIQGSSCTTTAASATCAITSPNATVTLTGSVTGGTSLSVSVPSVRNPYSTQTTSSFQIITYYDSLYDSLVDSITTGITISSVANQLTIASVTPSSFQVAATTSYTFSITLSDLVTAGGYFDLVFPAEVSFTSPTLTILSSSLENTCTLNPTGKTLRFSSCFVTANHSASVPLSFSLSSITNPSSFATSSAF